MRFPHRLLNGNWEMYFHVHRVLDMSVLGPVSNSQKLYLRQMGWGGGGEKRGRK